MKPALLQREIAGIPLLWLAVLLLAVWIVGTALFVYWVNPMLGGLFNRDTENAQMMGLNFSEMALARGEAVDHLRSSGAWPADVAALARVPDNGLLRIEIPEPYVIRFGMGRGFSPESGLRDTWLRLRFDASTSDWHCQNDTPPIPARWLPSDCQAPVEWSRAEVSLVALVGALLLLVLTLLALGFADPRLAALRRHPLRLRRQPVGDLPRLHRQLGWLRRRDASLTAAAIANDDWAEALAYFAAGADARAQLLALRVSARCIRSSGWSLPGQVYELQFPITLPIALDRALLYLPAPAVAARDLVRHLRSVQTGQDVLIVVSHRRDADATLFAYASDTANLCVCLDQATQSEWLLHPSPPEVLVALLARQLSITRISPYQTRGGITRPAAFFGREQLLAQVLNREPGNYLLVGGRQLGKTSLMKAIERRFADHPRVHCQYFSLRDHRLAERLAADLELAAQTPIEKLIEALAARAGQRRLLLLIDETDLFLREESRTGYAQLAALRSLSEEGRCHFMLAGFWDLYQATALDYASPIRNFGEVISLGALEHEACIALATRPLERLGIRFASPALVDDMVQACGQRANLVAILCQHGLEQLERGERVLTASHLQRSMQSDALHDALAGWARLSPDPQACALDRYIVYGIAQRNFVDLGGADALTLAAIAQELAAVDIRIEAEAIRGALLRLQLAFVLRRELEGYHFAVPLFARQFRAEETAALRAGELQSLRRDSN